MKPSLLSLISILLAIGSFGLLVYTSLFVTVVSKIECRLNTTACPSELTTDLTDSLLQTSLFWHDHQAAIEKIVVNHSAHLVSVTKQLPNQLIIQLQPVEQLFQVKTADQWLIVDAEQHQIFSDHPVSVPTIDIPPEKLNDQPTLHAISQLVQTLHKTDIPIQSLSVKEDALEMILDNGIVVKLPPREAAVQITRLELILTEMPNLELEPVTLIDLRFDHPVLRTGSEQNIDQAVEPPSESPSE